jgi:hypothetical protein
MSIDSRQYCAVMDEVRIPSSAAVLFTCLDQPMKSLIKILDWFRDKGCGGKEPEQILIFEKTLHNQSIIYTLSTSLSIHPSQYRLHQRRIPSK